VKVTIHVAAGSNEQIVVESELKNPTEWAEKVQPVFAHLEARVGDRARRLMAASNQLKELGKHSPELASLVQNLVLIALGQMPSVNTEGLVERAFEAPVLQKVEGAEEAA